MKVCTSTNGDEVISKTIFTSIESLLHDIRMAMRKDLQVDDCDDKEMIGEFSLIDVNPYLKKSWSLKMD